MLKYLYILGTLLFTVYGQLILKWRISLKGAAPQDTMPKVIYILKMYTDIWILSGFFSALLASACWMLAMTKFELSYAYPFTSLSFILIFIFSMIFFKESFTWWKFMGLLLISLGMFVSSRST